jgi:hypothetical protein
MAKTNPERFRLQVLGADEDVPRMLLAYGRGCGGEVAFVMRPRDGVAFHVHQVAKEPARVWRSDAGLAPFRAPDTEQAPGDALAELKRVKAAAPPAGPATLRGKWSGVLVCDDGTPSMTLERKVASYGTLRLASKPDGTWTATFDRAAKWFTTARQESAERASLAEAIQAGMGLVLGLVGEACSFRDTRRRNTVDAAYAAERPYTPPVAPRDPTERYAPRSSFRAVEAGDGWHVVNEVGGIVARFGMREKGKATRHAGALTRGGQVDTETVSSSPVASVSADVADAFGMGGLPNVTVTPSMTTSNLAPTLAEVPMPEPPACPVSIARIAAATEKEAGALEDLAGSLWGTTEVPELLKRAAKLIRYAEALVKSPLCTGRERTAAWDDLRRAAEAYTSARDAIARGEHRDMQTVMRRIAERVSLAAARAAKACAGGQQSLVPAPRTSDEVIANIEAQERATMPVTWRAGDRVVHLGKWWDIQRVGYDGQTVSLVPVGGRIAKAGVPISQLSREMPVAAPPAQERPRRVRAPRAPVVDAAKDAALANAFADAIKQAAAQLGGVS